ncbi:MAG TPA: hypothetical protein VGA20_09760 [Gemmatimonadales bacterium]
MGRDVVEGNESYPTSDHGLDAVEYQAEGCQLEPLLSVLCAESVEFTACRCDVLGDPVAVSSCEAGREGGESSGDRFNRRLAFVKAREEPGLGIGHRVDQRGALGVAD